MNRVCITCKVEKQLTREFFYRDKNRLCGFMYRCIECDKSRIKKIVRYSDLTDEQKLRAKKYKEKYAKGGMGRAISTLVAYRVFDKDKGLATDIDRFDVFEAREALCTYCGFPATGLDRKDNRIGHTKANCVPCCGDCNTARMNNFTHEEMLLIGETIRMVKARREFIEFGNCVL